MTPGLWIVLGIAAVLLVGIGWVKWQIDAMLDEQQAELMERIDSGGGQGE